MEKKHTEKLLKVIGAGVMTGMRAAAGPLVACYCYNNNHKDAKGFFTRPALLTGLQIGAIGELMVDKHPKAGDRIAPVGIIGRAAGGALAGSVINKDNKPKDKWLGALIGAGAAIAGTFISFYARKRIGKLLKIEDTLVGAAEDAIVLALTAWLSENG